MIGRPTHEHQFGLCWGKRRIRKCIFRNAFSEVLGHRARGNAPPKSELGRGMAAVPRDGSSFHCGVPTTTVPQPLRTGQAPGLPRCTQFRLIKYRFKYRYMYRFTVALWGNGGASDSRSEGCVFKSRHTTINNS